MNRVILRILPLSRHPSWIRFGGATLLTFASASLRMAFDPHLTGPSYFLFIPAIFISAVLFDHWAAYWATALSLVLSIWTTSDSEVLLRVRPDDVIPLTLFALTSLGIGAITEAVRDALVRERKAQEEVSLLYRELQHRMKNDLQVVTSVLGMEAREQDSAAARAALETAMSRIAVIARAHKHLEHRTGGALNMQPYIADLCDGLARLGAESRSIHIECDVEPISLPTGRAVLIGILVNELVTNAMKHAFPARNTTGTVRVLLHQSRQGLLLTVRDDGIGCPPASIGEDGTGSRLMRRIARQLHGDVKREPADPGCRVDVSIKTANAPEL